MNLTFDRNIFLRGQIDDDVARDIIAQLLFYQMDDAKAPVRLTIDSYGGSVTAALAILDTIKFFKNQVHTHCRGEAIGSALLLLGSGTKGFRSAASDARFGFVRLQFDLSKAGSDAAHFIEKLQRRFITQFAEESGQPEPTIAQCMEGETQFTTDGLLRFGLIDQIHA
jgi:ATP-dependent Clp protease, protease subunit